MVHPDDPTNVDYSSDLDSVQSRGVGKTIAPSPAETQRVIAGNTAGVGAVNTIVLGDAAGAISVVERHGPRYSLHTLHAAGGIGEIWLARDADLERDVAAKRLHSQQSSSAAAKIRFLREAGSPADSIIRVSYRFTSFAMMKRTAGPITQCAFLVAAR